MALTTLADAGEDHRWRCRHQGARRRLQNNLTVLEICTKRGRRMRETHKNHCHCFSLVLYLQTFFMTPKARSQRPGCESGEGACPSSASHRSLRVVVMTSKSSAIQIKFRLKWSMICKQLDTKNGLCGF